MGNLLEKEPPPPVVLVPPLFDFPPLAARTRMLEPSYGLLFGKLALRCLFEDYFDQERQFSARIMLKPIDDPHVDLVATVSGPLSHMGKEKVFANALFRWQRELEDPNTFVDLYVSNSEPSLRLRSCAYYPKYGVGAFTNFPLLSKKRTYIEDYGAVGFRYGSENISIGATMLPFPSPAEVLRSMWMVGKLGRLTVGLQFKPKAGSASASSFKDLDSYSCAISYGLGARSLLSPSYNFSLEVVKASQLVASFYQHAVVQRRVKNPFEEDEIVGITNYIDFGFEIETRIDGAESADNTEESTFRVAASWQANKNFLLKGKLSPNTYSVVLAFKSWWKPSFTFSITAVRDRLAGKTAFGFGFRVEDLRQASYERADPNYVMLTPTKEHLADGIIRTIGKRPMLQSDLESGNYDQLPNDLKPIGKIL